METPEPSRPAVPAVVAVVVSRDPGPWFDEALAALAAQDYPNLAVLVIDAASETDPTPRIAAALPDAYVRRLDHNPGFGAAANLVGEIVDGAAFYCFLHDDAAPEPSVVRTLVAEALRSNGGVVGPKLVRWDDTRRLLQVGDSADKIGERVPIVDRDELDQEQHDAVRDVFVVPGACTLVRADLFSAIGGYDEGIDLLNDDLSLCWRAHLAGARVIVAPDAVVRHQEALGDRSPVSERRRRLQRHRLRTMLTCYSRWHLLRVLPQAVLVAVIEVAYSFVVGRRGHAGDIVAAWRWNLSSLSEIRERRRTISAYRTVPDREVRRFQRRGSARLALFVRGQTTRGGERSERAVSVARRVLDGARTGEYRWSLVAWGATASIVLIGSRHLLTQPVPAVGEFVPFDLGPRALLDRYLSGWRDVGLGSESPAPTAFGLLSVAGTVFLGAMGTLRRVLILGPVIVGLVGAHRLAAPTGSRRTQAATLVVYASAPLAYGAIGEARWSALAIWAAGPWLLSALATAARWAPFGADAGGGATGRTTLARLGLLVAVLVAFAPAVLVVLAVFVVGLGLGGILTGQPRGLGRMLLAGLGAATIGIVVNLPWLVDLVLPGSDWEAVVGQRGAAEEVSLGSLLRFHVGPVGGDGVGVLLVVAALLPLLIGRGWRLAWAVRGWTLTLTSFAVAWAAERDAFPFALPAAGTLLVPALTGLTLCVALGVTAFEQDLRVHKFGWRQLAVGAAATCAALGTVPSLLDVGNGRWHLPSSGLERTFAFLDTDEPGYRVLWLGDPAVLPLDSYQLSDEVAYATSTDGLPTLADQWSGSPAGSTELLEDALRLAVDGETDRLGRLLAPMAVRYLVVSSAQAPAPLGGVTRPRPADLVEALDSQLDLAEVPLNPSFVVYRNEAALSARSVVAARAGSSVGLDVARDELAGARPALEDSTGPTSFEGPIPDGSRILHSTGASSGWELVVDGEPAERVKLFGWADGFDVTEGGEAVLRYRTSAVRYLLVVVQAAAWIALVRAAWRRPTDVVVADPPPAEPVPVEVPVPVAEGVPS